MSRQFRYDDTSKWIYGFGNGLDGTTYSTPANQGCSGTSGTTSLTLDSAGSFANNDLVMIHQTRGTGAGNWELNKISSGAGTTSLTMVHNLENTYADSGSSQAQIITLKQYSSFNTGSISAPSWDGSRGGIIAFLCNGTTTINGTIEGNGGNGGTGTGASPGAAGTGGGFDGGLGDTVGESGEGTSGASTNTNSANGNGGGGGDSSGAGGGGGNGAAGSAGSGLGTAGAGGNQVGNASLTSFMFGGGGGGGDTAGGDSSWTTGSGGAGGAIALIISKDIVVSGGLQMKGGNGGAPSSGSGQASGGGGSGGSILIKCQTATLGSGLIVATAGLGGTNAFRNGGNGGTGRIHIDYKTSYTGTTSPTIDATQDSTLTYPSNGSLFYAQY